MTRKITKKQRKEQIIAIISLAIVVATLITMFGMGIYTLTISFESQNYTREILQAEQDSISYPEEKRQEYVDSVSVEARENREALYDSNAYTQWFFNTINGLQRLFVLALWFIVPTAIIYIVVKC